MKDENMLYVVREEKKRVMLRQNAERSMVRKPIRQALKLVIPMLIHLVICLSHKVLPELASQPGGL